MHIFSSSNACGRARPLSARAMYTHPIPMHRQTSIHLHQDLHTPTLSNTFLLKTISLDTFYLNIDPIPLGMAANLTELVWGLSTVRQPVCSKWMFTENLIYHYTPLCDWALRGGWLEGTCKIEKVTTWAVTAESHSNYVMSQPNFSWANKRKPQILGEQSTLSCMGTLINTLLWIKQVGWA